METINARQLLLLCALRKKPVQATNLEVYEFTYLHWRYIQHQLLEIEEWQNRTQKEKQFLEEANKKFPKLEQKLRTFYIHENDFITLAEREGITWYGSSLVQDCRYTGAFKLHYPLTRVEEFILNDYK